MSTSYPPGPKQPPLVGSLRAMRSDRLGFLLACYQTYGDTVYFKLGPRHAYLMNNPDDTRSVLVEQAEHFYKAPLFKKHTAPVIGDGLLTSEGELHKRQRRLIQPAFHHQHIAGYGEVMVDFTLKRLEGWHDGDTLDMHREMTRLTMDIVTRVLFGADVSASGDEIGRAIEHGLHFVIGRTLRPLSPPLWIPTPQNLRAKKNFKLLNDLIDSIIQERHASGEDKGDLLSTLLMAIDEEGSGEGMTDLQARKEAMTLFIAGHETTANALTWTLRLLAEHPAAAETLRAELDSALGGRAPTVRDLPNLPYTEMVIKESMRLYPPAWSIPRLAVDDVTVGGWPIKRGSIILLCPYTAHRNPRYFPDPERFMPERFAGDFEQRIPRYAYFPFGAGPRVCVGNGFAMMEARLILAAIVQAYRFDLVPGQDPRPQALVTLRPRGGLWMTLAKRAAHLPKGEQAADVSIPN
jgi:cytochrome P450